MTFTRANLSRGLHSFAASLDSHDQEKKLNVGAGFQVLGGSAMFLSVLPLATGFLISCHGAFSGTFKVISLSVGILLAIGGWDAYQLGRNLANYQPKYSTDLKRLEALTQWAPASRIAVKILM